MKPLGIFIFCLIYGDDDVNAKYDRENIENVIFLFFPRNPIFQNEIKQGKKKQGQLIWYVRTRTYICYLLSVCIKRNPLNGLNIVI